MSYGFLIQFSKGCGSFAFRAKVRSVNWIAVTLGVPGLAKQGDNDAVAGYGGLA